MEEKYIKLVEPYQEDAEKELVKYLSINSIHDEETITDEKPFGNGVHNALTYLAELGEKMGFKVDRCDNYCTELSYGEGELIDVYAHADVVPVSSSWSTDPFKPTIKNGNIYARGAADDKGPGLATLFAAKALLDNDMIKGYRLRLVFGGNEERGSKCLEHYFGPLEKGYPKFGFSPDADFPMIYAEKSIHALVITHVCPGLPDFEAGEASNIVIGDAKISTKSFDKTALEEALQKYRSEHHEVTISYHNDELHFIGKPCHGSTPKLGVNAGLHMLAMLGAVLNSDGLKGIASNLLSGDGVPFKGDYTTSDFMDGTSYCVGLMSCKNHVLTVVINARTAKEEFFPEISKKLCRALPSNCTVKDAGGCHELVMPLKSTLVKTLLSVYQKETGDRQTMPMAIGGGTYAKESKNTIAFGPTFPGRDYRIHQDDEFIPLEDFHSWLVIYAHAIDALGKACKD